MNVLILAIKLTNTSNTQHREHPFGIKIQNGLFSLSPVQSSEMILKGSRFTSTRQATSVGRKDDAGG